MFPCTLPFTITVLLFTSPRTSACSPIARIPSTEEISPCRFPSKTNSFTNLTEPLISTSFERLFLLDNISAIMGVGCVTINGLAARAVVDSPRTRRLPQVPSLLAYGGEPLQYVHNY